MWSFFCINPYSLNFYTPIWYPSLKRVFCFQFQFLELLNSVLSSWNMRKENWKILKLFFNVLDTGSSVGSFLKTSFQSRGTKDNSVSVNCVLRNREQQIGCENATIKNKRIIYISFIIIKTYWYFDAFIGGQKGQKVTHLLPLYYLPVFHSLDHGAVIQSWLHILWSLICVKLDSYITLLYPSVWQLINH